MSNLIPLGYEIERENVQRISLCKVEITGKRNKKILPMRLFSILLAR